MMNFNNIYRDYLLQESDVTTQTNPYTVLIYTGKVDTDTVNSMSQSEYITLTPDFADKLAFTFVTEPDVTEDTLKVMIDKEFTIKNKPVILNTNNLPVNQLNQSVLDKIATNLKANLGSIKSNRIMKDLVNKWTEYKTGKTNTEAERVELYSKVGSKEVDNFPISQNALNAIANVRLHKAQKGTRWTGPEFEKLINSLVDINNLDKDVGEVILKCGERPYANMSMLWRNPTISKKFNDGWKKYKNALQNSEEDTQLNDSTLEKLYLTTKEKEGYEEYKKELEDLYNDLFEKTKDITDTEARNMKIVEKLESYISTNPKDNKIIIDVLNDNGEDTIQLAVIMSHAESQRLNNDLYNAPTKEVDKVKELEDDFASIKEDYEKLIKSKDAKRLSKDNKVAHALLKTCGGILTGAAFIIGGLTKFAGKFIPGATLYTPATAKIAKGLRTVGKLSWDAGSPLSAKSSKEIKKDLAKKKQKKLEKAEKTEKDTNISI